jgi:molecular chaperone DnaK (HSP70)
MSERLGYSIGIDFGTTKSAISWVDMEAEGGRAIPRHVKLYRDADFMPSCVYIEDAEGARKFLVGQPAVDRFVETGDLDRYFTQFKLELGAEKLDERYARFAITPSFLTMLVIEQLLKYAVNPKNGDLAAGGELRSAALTIPAKWSEGRKTETEEAAQAAGLSELRLVKEPDAALHWVNREGMLTSGDRQTYMVVDYGGGTCDVAILRTFSRGQEARIIGQHTLEHGAGGRDVDKALANLIAKWAKKEWQVDDEALEPFRRGWDVDAETMKLGYVDWYYSDQLYGDQSPIVRIRGLGRYPDFNRRLTPEDFNATVDPVVKNIMTPIKNALKEANLREDQVDQVFLVGGSSALPSALETVQGKFGGRAKLAPAPRSAVCFGAALWQHYKRVAGREGSTFGSYHYSTLSIQYQEHSKRKNEPPIINHLKLAEKGPILQKHREPHTLELTVPEDGQEYLLIQIVESDVADTPGSEPEIKYSDRLSLPTGLRKGTIIRITHFINLDDRLELSYRILGVRGDTNPVQVTGRRPVSPERIAALQAMRRPELGGRHLDESE